MLTEELARVDRSLGILVRMEDLARSVSQYVGEGKEEAIGKIADLLPNEDADMRQMAEELGASLPTGYQIGAPLLRHVHFGEPVDWNDIGERDAPAERRSLLAWRSELAKIALVDSLHPNVQAIRDRLVEKDYDGALTLVFKKLETELRRLAGDKYTGLSAVDVANKALGSKGTLRFDDQKRQDAIRSYVAGVLGMWRNDLLHRELDAQEMKMDYCLPALVVASETFKLLDRLSVHTSKGLF